MKKTYRPLSLLLILAVAAVAVSIPRAAAATTMLSVNPAVKDGIPGSPAFPVSVDITDVPDIIAYDVSLSWDSRILEAISIADGDIFAAHSHFIVANETGLGFARLASTLLGTVASVPVGTSKSLFVVQMRFVGFGETSLRIFDDTLVDSTITAIPHVNADGVARTPPPADASLVKWKARPDIRHLSLSTRGDKNTFFADVREASSVSPAFIRVVYSVVSSAGDVSSASSPIIQLPPGSEIIISAEWTAPSALPLRYFATALLQVSGDGVTFLDDDTKTFSFSVVP